MSSEKKVPVPEDLQEILRNLRDIANKVQTDSNFCKGMYQQLYNCGYRWSSDKDVSMEQNIVMKLFCVAVNEAIQKQVNLSLLDTKTEETKLYSLLGIDEKKKLSGFFLPPPPFQRHAVPAWLGNARSPLDIAIGLTNLKRAPLKFVKKIIQSQFDIRWNTSSPSIHENGKPDDYTFYQFCDKQNSREFLKYKPRLAHIKATLYKECMSDKFLSYIHYDKEELCPEVFIKTLGGWKIWNANEPETFLDQENFNDYFSWVNEHIRTAIEENADIESGIEDNLEKALKEPTLYWAVLDDKDFEAGEKLKLHEIGQTQVYVGKANNGIYGRWTHDSDNHCEMMKKCLDNVYAMMTYDPSRLEGIQLVDARLVLAKVRGERSALFLIKTFGDDVKKAEMIEQEAEEALEASQAGSEERSRRAEERAKATDNKLKKMKERSKSDKSKEKTKTPEEQLRDAEVNHIKGKRHDLTHRNIIPSKCKIEWTPKDMAYGMNGKE